MDLGIAQHEMYKLYERYEPRTLVLSYHKRSLLVHTMQSATKKYWQFYLVLKEAPLGTAGWEWRLHEQHSDYTTCTCPVSHEGDISL